MAMIKMTPEEILAKANEIVSPYGLKAEFLGEIQRVGVKGDARAYEPVLVLVGPEIPMRTVIRLSTELSNTLPVTVTLDITPKQGSPG